jgi:hypothetical protein
LGNGRCGGQKETNKLPAVSPKRIRPTATYKEIKITVPNAPLLVALPSMMTFYVDSRFTTAQVNRIKQIISIALNEWRIHYDQLNNGAVTSNYQNFVNKYARFNLSPV